ncbi:MAG: STAS domain-containing protein [Leptospiraceae bacterium]|nr:STAS domain-containing protein [Leptospiraceae bacterium]
MSAKDVIIEAEGTTLRIQLRVASLSTDNVIMGALGDHRHPSQPFEKLMLDFDLVEYINSTGVSEIINIYRLFKDQSMGSFEMVLFNVTPRVKAILELVEIHNIATVRQAF